MRTPDVRASLLLATACLAIFSATAPTFAAAQAKHKKKAAPAAGNVQAGLKLYGKNCVVCHGANGIGDEGPALKGLAMSDSGFAYTVKKGLKGGMPAFGGKLKDNDIKDLLAYVRSLSKKK
jgi:mono/diheme cytochrome c family protein